MRVKYCLVGVAALAMPGQAEAWGFFGSLVKAIASIFVPAPAPAPTPAPTPKPTPKPVKSKTIVMRANIVPTWEELAPAGAVKIKLERVNDYWSDLLGSDLKTYQTLFTTTTEKEAAKVKIQTYYNEAAKCLSAHSLVTPNPPEVFKVNIEAVRICVSKSIVPTFVVEDTNKVTPALPAYVPGDHLDLDDYAPPPPPTLVPTLTPTSEPVADKQSANDDPDSIALHVSAVETSSPSIADIPSTNDTPPAELPVYTPPERAQPSDVVAPDTSNVGARPLEVLPAPPAAKILEDVAPSSVHEELHPRVATVPSFRTLDVDGDGLMSSDEWLDYVNKLTSLALTTAKKATDKQGLELLEKVIEYHYKRLANCVTSITREAREKALNTAQFQAVVPSINANCDVKFRYSLLAGPPPFEWVAARKAAVTAEHVSNWFASQLETANKRSMPVPPALSHLVSCIESKLAVDRRELVNRDKFYSTITGCSSQN